MREVNPLPEESESIASVEDQQGSEPFPLYPVLSVLMILGSLIFAAKGWHTLYDDSYSARIVGGDAFNFIIYATRGTALICLGIVCAVLSVTFAVFAVLIKMPRS